METEPVLCRTHQYAFCGSYGRRENLWWCGCPPRREYLRLYDRRVLRDSIRSAAEGDEPNLAQLRGSGSIEQDADVVMFIHGDRKANKETNEGYDPVQQRKIIVAKQRNGPVGDVDVIFLSNYTKFENKSREEQ